MGDTHTRPSQLTRDEQIRHAVEEVLLRRHGGEEVANQAVYEEHPHLMPELAAELRKLAVIERAREQLHRMSAGEPASQETAEFTPSKRQAPRVSRSLHIRCPLCHERLVILADQPLEDLACTACRGRFNLAGDDPELKGQQPLTRIARFELLARLGMGSFGTVWKARDVELERTVALKIPRRGQL